jgi:hypothetical protein
VYEPVDPRRPDVFVSTKEARSPVNRKLAAPLGLVLLASVNSGCGEAPGSGGAGGGSAAAPAPAASRPAPPRRTWKGPGFTDRFDETGVRWKHRAIRSEIENRFNLYDHGSAVAVADYNADGKDDIYLMSLSCGNVLLRNKGENRFEDVTARAGVALAGRVNVACAFGDYDNDGYPDLFVATTRGGNVLFHNDGKAGTFTDVTKTAGVGHVGHSCAVLWFDYDNDGFLDLYVGNSGKYTTDVFDQATASYVGTGFDIRGWLEAPRERGLLYHNEKNGKFTDVAERAGVRGSGWVGDASACDIDGDGWVDFYVTNMFGENALYRNRGDGTFEDMTRKLLGKTSFGAMGGKWADVDNDGRLDLYVVDMHSDMWLDFRYDMTTIEEWHRYESPFGPEKPPQQVVEFYKTILKGDNYLFGNSFFRAKPDGTFAEMGPAAGLETFWPWSIAAGDFDGDGFVDYYVASGMGYPFPYWPDYLLMNTGDVTFVNQARELGVEPRKGGPVYGEILEKPATRSSRAAAVADFDSDGRLDMIVNNYNHEPSYLPSEFPRPRWRAVKLVGRSVNRDAVGAKVVLKAGRSLYTRVVEGAGGYLAQSSSVLHFGLGSLDQVEELAVYWPGKKVQRIAKPALDRMLVLREP